MSIDPVEIKKIIRETHDLTSDASMSDTIALSNVLTFWDDAIRREYTLGWDWRDVDYVDAGSVFRHYIRTKYADALIGGCMKKVKFESSTVVNTRMLKKTMHKCLSMMSSGGRFIMIFLSLPTTSKGYHANALVIDTVVHTGELMEPHGTGIYGGDSMLLSHYDAIRMAVLSLATPQDERYTFIPPDELCPRVQGFQYISEASEYILKDHERGYCGAWTYWYIELRLTYPDLPPQELISDALDAFTEDPRICVGVIRNYAQVLMLLLRD